MVRLAADAAFAIIAASGGENHCERHSDQACASQAFGQQISADKTFAR
jgi:hypothetical protein